MMNRKENPLTETSDFIVKESKWTNIVFGILLSVLALVVLHNIYSDYHADQIAVYKKMLILTLIPAVVFIMRGKLNKQLFRINRNGFYRCNELLTDWKHFINARITQEEITGSFADNFILLVEFTKDDQPGVFVRKMKLPNTMDASEEEIIEAIRYFSFLFFNQNHLPAENNEQSV